MKSKTTIVMLALMVSMAWLIGCADVPSSGPTPPEFNSEFRFINAAEDAGDLSISVDGQSAGSVAFGAATSHATYLAGNRVATLSSGDELLVAMTTDQRASVLILPMTGAVREFIKLIERGFLDSATTSNALIRAVHASSDAGLTTFTIQNADTTATTLPGVFRDFTSYSSFPAGSYELSVVTASGVTLTSTVDLTNIRQTVILIGSEANGTLDLIKLDDN